MKYKYIGLLLEFTQPDNDPYGAVRFQLLDSENKMVYESKKDFDFYVNQNRDGSMFVYLKRDEQRDTEPHQIYGKMIGIEDIEDIKFSRKLDFDVYSEESDEKINKIISDHFGTGDKVNEVTNLKLILKFARKYDKSGFSKDYIDQFMKGQRGMAQYKDAMAKFNAKYGIQPSKSDDSEKNLKPVKKYILTFSLENDKDRKIIIKKIYSYSYHYGRNFNFIIGQDASVDETGHKYNNVRISYHSDSDNLRLGKFDIERIETEYNSVTGRWSSPLNVWKTIEFIEITPL